MTINHKGHEVDDDFAAIAASLKSRGYEDTTWVNDGAPSFGKDGLNFRIWVHPVKQSDREIPEIFTTRFAVVTDYDKVTHPGADLEPLWATDDFGSLFRFLDNR